MKSTIIALLLLAAIAGQGQNTIIGYHRLLPPTSNKDTIKPLYDTIEVIAEVYQLRHKLPTGYYIGVGCFGLKPDSIWSWKELDYVRTSHVLAWEVWRLEWRQRGIPIYWQGADTGDRNYITELVPVERVKRLTYDRMEELTHVLQTWPLNL